MVAALEPLRPWNTHWGTGQVSPLVMKTEHERAAVPHLVTALLDPPRGEWTLLAGPRQIGKTTSLGHVARRLMADHGVEPRRVAFVPLDQPAVHPLVENGFDGLVAALTEAHAPFPKEPLFLLLDEVQDMANWAKALKAAWDRHHPTVRVVATGSSALRIIRPAEADFPGRVRVETVHPMKFREVVRAHPSLAQHLSPEGVRGLEERAKAARQAIVGKESDREVGALLEDLHAFVGDASPTLEGFLQQVFAEHVVWGGYPHARAGAASDPARRRDVFEQAWNAVLAKDVPAAGLVKTREFTLLFHRLALNTGGKFVPHNLGGDLGVKAETLSQWKRLLEDAMLVQQLMPLKPNLDPARGKDKAYLLDTGWYAYFTGLLDHSEMSGRPAEGALVETLLADHVRRLQFAATRSRTFPLGYVEDPEVDIAADLGRRWLLIEAKYRSTTRSHVGEVDAPGSRKFVVTRRHFETPDGEGVFYLPAHEFALLC